MKARDSRYCLNKNGFLLRGGGGGDQWGVSVESYHGIHIMILLTLVVLVTFFFFWCLLYEMIIMKCIFVFLIYCLFPLIFN